MLILSLGPHIFCAELANLGKMEEGLCLKMPLNFPGPRPALLLPHTLDSLPTNGRLITRAIKFEDTGAVVAHWNRRSALVQTALDLLAQLELLPHFFTVCGPALFGAIGALPALPAETAASILMAASGVLGSGSLGIPPEFFSTLSALASSVIVTAAVIADLYPNPLLAPVVDFMVAASAGFMRGCADDTGGVALLTAIGSGTTSAPLAASALLLLLRHASLKSWWRATTPLLQVQCQSVAGRAPEQLAGIIQSEMQLLGWS
jgi:hypothetical protein